MTSLSSLRYNMIHNVLLWNGRDSQREVVSKIYEDASKFLEGKLKGMELPASVKKDIRCRDGMPCGAYSVLEGGSSQCSSHERFCSMDLMLRWL